MKLLGKESVIRSQTLFS